MEPAPPIQTTNLCKKYGESVEVVHAVAAHHEDIAPLSPLDVMVQAADTLSGARPGARREMLETYVRRLEDLENIDIAGAIESDLRSKLTRLGFTMESISVTVIPRGKNWR